MSMFVGKGSVSTEFTPYIVLERENSDGSRIINVEFRNLEMDVNHYIDIDINSKTLTKSEFQKQIMEKTRWRERAEERKDYSAEELKIFSSENLDIFNCCGEWTESLLNDPANQGFVDFLRDKKLFHVVFRKHDH